MIINSGNDPNDVFEKHFSLRCPHCGQNSNMSAVSLPRYEFLTRFKPERVGIAYRCDACNEPVFLKFVVQTFDTNNSKIHIYNDFEEIERPSVGFDFEYLPEAVEKDFREACICFSNSCWNAFGAMCRRCIQSSADRLGAKGKDKVERQIKDLKEMASIDDETFDALRQIMLGGHDASHPSLPELTPERATVLLELMKDVLYQLFVRSAKIEEAAKLRSAGVAELKPANN